MILFFRSTANSIYAVGTQHPLHPVDIDKLIWLFSGAQPQHEKALTGNFIGPRKEMVTPWSTNAVEITQNMGIAGIIRIEEFYSATEQSSFDRMLQHQYAGLDQDLFTSIIRLTRLFKLKI
jgi:phosphoribosylformylglycinamidine synthase